MDISVSVIEKVLSSHGVVVLNLPQKIDNGYCFQCWIGKYTAEDGARERTIQALVQKGYGAVITMDGKEDWGNCHAFVSEHNGFAIGNR